MTLFRLKNILLTTALLYAPMAYSAADAQTKNIVGAVVIPYIESLNLSTQLASTQTQLEAANEQIDTAELLLSGTAIPDAAAIDAIASRLTLETPYPGVNPSSPLLDQINLGLIPYLQAALVKLGEYSPIKQIASGLDFTVVLLENGTVWATGNNSSGQLGDGTFVEKDTLTKMTGANNVNIIAIAAGSAHTLLLKDSGIVYATGDNRWGQLGIGFAGGSENTLFKMSGSENSAAIAAGVGHSLVLKSNGTVWATGNNSAGELGDGQMGTNKNVLTTMTGGNNANMVAIAAGGLIVEGGGHSVVLKSDGTVWATGNGASGQLGGGVLSNIDFLTLMTTANTNVVAISAGGEFTAVLKGDGTVWATGANEAGQLGDGTTAQKNVLTTMTTANSNIIAVSAGGAHTLVLKADGTTWATGNNAYGQLGLGTTGGTNTTLAQMFGADNVNLAAIAGGGLYSITLKSDGSAWATGYNSFGQLGIGVSGGSRTTLTQMAPFLG